MHCGRFLVALVLLAIGTHGLVPAASGEEAPERPANYGNIWVRNSTFVIMSVVTYRQPYDETLFPQVGFNTAQLPLANVNSNTAPIADRSWHAALGTTIYNQALADQALHWAETIAGNTGFLVADEPPESAFPAIGQMMDYLKERSPQSLVYSAIGGNFGADYEELVDALMTVARPDVLFDARYDAWRGQSHLDLNGHFNTLMTVRRKAQQYKVPHFTWVQAFSHLPSNTAYPWRLPSESELRLTTFTQLAAGTKGLAYFTYSGADYPSLESAIVNAGGNPSPLYAAMQSLTVEVTNLGKSLHMLESTDLRFIPGNTNAIAHAAPNGLTNWSVGAGGDGLIQNAIVLGSGAYKDGLISFFTDDNGQKYFMITNLYHEATAASDETSLSFRVLFDNSVNELLRLNRLTGAQELVPLVNHTLTTTLPGGTGDLFKYNDGDFAVPEPSSEGRKRDKRAY